MTLQQDNSSTSRTSDLTAAIASMLGVFIVYVQSRFAQYGLRVRLIYSDVSDADLDELVARGIRQQMRYDGWFSQ